MKTYGTCFWAACCSYKVYCNKTRLMWNFIVLRCFAYRPPISPPPIWNAQQKLGHAASIDVRETISGQPVWTLALEFWKFWRQRYQTCLPSRLVLLMAQIHCLLCGRDQAIERERLYTKYICYIYRYIYICAVESKFGSKNGLLGGQN